MEVSETHLSMPEKIAVTNFQVLLAPALGTKNIQQQNNSSLL
jgi:hypothetical protein